MPKTIEFKGKLVLKKRWELKFKVHGDNDYSGEVELTLRHVWMQMTRSKACFLEIRQVKKVKKTS